MIIGDYLNGKTLDGSTDKKEEVVILYSNIFYTTIVNTKSNTNNRSK